MSTHLDLFQKKKKVEFCRVGILDLITISIVSKSTGNNNKGNNNRSHLLSTLFLPGSFCWHFPRQSHLVLITIPYG